VNNTYSGVTVQEFYNVDSGADRWYFDAVGYTRIDLKGNDLLNVDSFGPNMELWKVEGDSNILVVPDDGTGLIEFTATEGVVYFVQVSNDEGWDSFYNLSINDQLKSTLWEFWTDGVSIIGASSITGSGSNQFNSNSVTGLGAFAKGNISLSGNTVAKDNGTEGLLLDNYTLGGNGKVTVFGAAFADYNGWQGLSIKTSGIVSVTNLEVLYNMQGGVYIDSYGLNIPVTLQTINAQHNSWYGVKIDASGKITLNAVKAWLNWGDGAYLISYGYPISVLSSSFISNGDYGLELEHGSGLFTNTGSIYLDNYLGNLYEH
jgi:hypothetical protein